MLKRIPMLAALIVLAAALPLPAYAGDDGGYWAKFLKERPNVAPFNFVVSQNGKYAFYKIDPMVKLQDGRYRRIAQADPDKPVLFFKAEKDKEPRMLCQHRQKKNEYLRRMAVSNDGKHHLLIRSMSGCTNEIVSVESKLTPLFSKKITITALTILSDSRTLVYAVEQDKYEKIEAHLVEYDIITKTELGTFCYQGGKIMCYSSLYAVDVEKNKRPPADESGKTGPITRVYCGDLIFFELARYPGDKIYYARCKVGDKKDKYLADLKLKIGHNCYGPFIDEKTKTVYYVHNKGDKACVFRLDFDGKHRKLLKTIKHVEADPLYIVEEDGERFIVFKTRSRLDGTIGWKKLSTDGKKLLPLEAVQARAD